MRNLTTYPALVTALILGVGTTACGGSELQGRAADAVTTTITPSTVIAGQQAAVECAVWSPSGQRLADAPTTFEAPTADHFTVQGNLVSSTKAGGYDLHCRSDIFSLRDDDGARLQVTAAAPARVRTVLDKNEVKIFETANATCIVEDAFGNIVDNVSTTVTGPEQLTIVGFAVSSDTLGTYDVECVLTDGTVVATEPAELKVGHGDPASVELIATPDRDAYTIGEQVDLTWIVRDAQGNPIDGLPATLTSPTTGVDDLGAADGAHGFEFTAEGIYTWTVRLDAPYELISDDLTLVCDASGPTIVIDFPERGATILGDGSQPVVVEGTITDDSGGIGTFEINGQPVAVNEDGTFSHPLDALWGVNLMDIVASDDFGNLTELTPTFHYAAEYTSFVDTDAKGIVEDDGLSLLLGQLFLDDGDHDHANPNDLATLLEIIIGDLDISSLIGGVGGSVFNQTFNLLSLPVINIGIFALDITGDATIDVKLVPPTGFGSTMVTIDARDGGIDTIIEMGNAQENGLDLNLEISIEIVLAVNWEFLGFPDSASATASAVVNSSVSAASMLFGADIDMDKDPGSDLTVNVSNVSVDLVQLEIDPIQDIVFTFTVDLPLIGNQSFNFNLSQLIDINAITDLILDPLTTQLLPLLTDLVTPLIETFADDVLVALFNAFELTLPLPLPPLSGQGPPKDLEIYTNLSSVKWTDLGGQIGLGFGVWADKGVERDPLGAINRVGCNLGLTETFTYAWDKSVGAALKSDSINGLLFAMWWSGFLNGPLDLGALAGGGLPISGLTLDLNPLLPPILNDCDSKITEGDILEIEIGDMWADIDVNLLGTPIVAGIYMDLGLQVQFESLPDGLYVNILGLSYIDIEVIEIQEVTGGLFDPEELLKDGLPDLISGFIAGQSLGPIAIPAIDLGGLLPGLPPGVALELGEIGIAPQDGYTVLDANLQ